MGKEKEVAEMMAEYSRSSYTAGFVSGFLISTGGIFIGILINIVITT